MGAFSPFSYSPFIFRGGVSEVKRVLKVFMPRGRKREHVGHSVSHFGRSIFPDRVVGGGLISVSLHLAVALLVWMPVGRENKCGAFLSFVLTGFV